MGKIAQRYLDCEPWRVAETGFHPRQNRVSESVFALANERMGVRGYAEEGTDAPHMRGSYFGGVYEWGEEAAGGYRGVVRRTHYMVCAADFLAVRLWAGGEPLAMPEDARGFSRVLDMRSGLLVRSYTRDLPGGGEIALRFERLLGMDDATVAAQRITLEASRDVQITLEWAIDGALIHQATGRCLWTKEEARLDGARASIRLRTATTNQTIDYAFASGVPGTLREEARGVSLTATLNLSAGVPTAVSRRIVCRTDGGGAMAHLADAPDFDALLAANRAHYDAFWPDADVEIDGDPLNQQGVRYCIFQLHQTYRGLDARNNVGAKGLTGEAYNGHAFWDSETYCMPYYLLNDWRAAKNLLLFRYRTLEAAKARAKELDCAGACYPIATLNGHEACTLWQHASLQMQPSTAVAYAIMAYARVTGDRAFLHREGAQMLTEICRYVVSRGGWNADHTRFGFWGVMGPDEFHMMVNNNFYTNYMGQRVLLDTLAVLDELPDPDALASREEREAWADIAAHMALNRQESGLIEQHDGYFTLPHLDIHSIPVEEFPLYDHWSYDRIYRTDMLKQPDVLMAMFLHPEDFSDEELRVNYDYYEPRCIHESSLSPSIHAVLAQRLGRDKAAFDFFGFATRLDLDNYNRNTEEGLHLANIAAAWVTIVCGFGGLRMDGARLSLAPHLPDGFARYAFRFRAGESVVLCEVTRSGCALSLLRGAPVTLTLYGRDVTVSAR